MSTQCFFDPSDRIVVGEAQSLDSGPAGFLHCLGGGAQAVGAKGVGMEVSQIVAHGSLW